MPIPALPNGFTLDETSNVYTPPLPAGFTLDAAPAPVAPSLLGRSVERLKTGATDAAGEILPAIFSREGQGMGTAVRKAVGGDVIPAVGDVVSDVVLTAGKKLLPLSAQNVVAQGVQAVAGSPPMQAVGKGLTTWKKASPDSYEAAGDYANIAGVLMPSVKFPTSALAPSVKASNALTAAVKRKKKIASILEPDNIITEARGKVSEEGLLRSRTYNPTDTETRMYDEVDAIPEVDPLRSNLHNLNAIESAVDTHRNALDAALVGAPAIPLSSVAKNIDDEILKIADTPTLVGDAGKSAERVYRKFQKIVDGYSVGGNITAGDLLQSRRDLDTWLKANSGKVFDSTANARGTAVSALRRRINDMVAQAAPNVEVKDLLQRQADLLTARDILAPRAQREGANSLSRAIASVEADTGLGPPRTPLAMQANLTSIPAMLATSAGTLGSLGARKAGSLLRAGKLTGAHLTDMAVNTAAAPLTQAAARAAALRATSQEDDK